jgi:hypothetical protein
MESRSTCLREYIFHVGKAFEIQRDNYLNSTVENNSSLTGFQGSSDIAAKLAIIAVPEERFAPYLSTTKSCKHRPQLGYPSSAALTTQEDFDAFEFCEPHIPLISRANARFRATGWGALGANPSITALENTLLAEHEVIADVYHKTAPEGGHVLLIIGFERNRQVFFAKNSWGENQFIEIHYQNDPNWEIRAAHYLTDVDNPSAFVQNDSLQLVAELQGQNGTLADPPLRRFPSSWTYQAGQLLHRGAEIRGQRDARGWWSDDEHAHRQH